MEEVQFIARFAPWIAMISIAGVIGWVFTTWLRVKNGYPLDGAWGQAVYPKTSSAEMERIKLLSTEMRSCVPSSGRSRTGWRRSNGSSPTKATI